MKKSELNQLIKEEIKKALKEASIPENTLMSALKKAGIVLEDGTGRKGIEIYYADKSRRLV